MTSPACTRLEASCPHAAQLLAKRFVEAQQLRREGGGGLVARRFLLGELCPNPAAGLVDCGLQALDLLLELAPAFEQLAGVRVERLGLGHGFEQLVLETGAVPLQRIDVGLQSLELAGGCHRARIQLGVDLGDLLLHAGQLVLEPFLPAADVTLLGGQLFELSIDVGSRRLPGQQLGAFGQRVQPMPQPIDDGVVALKFEEIVEDCQGTENSG
jgi:hypothetical protein